ncbi:hypothetical protein JVT61DRAFT_4228 [Boletus reticuloceps]|uniref:Uncharacterized protein n=1 Tax=Boletus reticuloceps TaxID=495285 RepID=A0A8I3A7M4_9AGAM|nr:hypothetical protein JVT61DRAFT_4228 [Boletus reticuloceps]
MKYRTRFTKQELMQEAQDRFAAKLSKRDTLFSKHERIRARKAWKRSLADRANGTIDPWYGCDLYDEMLDYAINFTFPWSLSKSSGGTFDIYNVPDALNPEAPMDASVFLNDPHTRAAIHAPTSLNWTESIYYPFGNSYSNGDPSVAPIEFLSDLATNATAHDMKIIIYSGNDDSLVPHVGSQGEPPPMFIQVVTWLTPLTYSNYPKYDVWWYPGLHSLSRSSESYIFGSNQTGLVTNTDSGSVAVIGGEIPSLGNDIFPGQAGIYYGSATTASTYFFPTATVEAWNKFTATAAPYPT